jgi:hypothetical protein
VAEPSGKSVSDIVTKDGGRSVATSSCNFLLGSRLLTALLHAPLQMKVEDDTYQLKPMNCPCHIAIYKDSLHSYRELPIRWAELGTVYRYEKSGTMHGLFRVRGFTQVSPNST